MKRFLTLVLALVLALNTLAFTAFAANEPVSVSDFAEFKAAVESATDGDVIKVTADIAITAPVISTANVTIEADSNVTLDASGVVDAFVATADALTLGENITIVSNTSVLYANGGNIVVDGASITSSSSYYALGFSDSGASIIVESGSVVCTNTSVLSAGSDGSIVINGGSVSTTEAVIGMCAVCGTGTIIMNGGTVSAAKGSGIAPETGGKATVTGGTVDNVTSRMPNSSITISDDANITGSVGFFANGTTPTGAKLTITGGTIGGIVGTVQDTVFAITGGKFTTYDVSELLSDDYAVTDGEVKLICGILKDGIVNLGGFITTEIDGLKAKESVVVKIYSGETHIATTTWQSDLPVSDPIGVTTTVKTCFAATSSSWATEWEAGKLSADYIPDSAVLFVDGVECNTAKIDMIAASTEDAVDWAEVIPANDIIISVEGEGTVVASKSEACVGEKIDVTFTPAEGYSLGYSEVLDAEGNAITFEDGSFIMPEGEVTIVAYFTELPVYEVYTSVLGTGRVSTAQDSYYAGATVRLNITHDVGYSVRSISVIDAWGNSIPVDGNSFVMPDCEVEVNVVFVKILPKPAIINFVANVELDGADIEAGSCKFQLSYLYRGKEYVIETATNDANGKVEFAPIYTYAPQSYTFFIKQIAVDDAGVEYDATVYEIDAVIDYSKGYLAANVSETTVDFVNYVK